VDACKQPGQRPRPTPARALSPLERQSVLDVLHEERFVDLAPPQVYAELLEEGRFLCSIRSMYRYLEAAREVKERRDIRRHPPAVKPRLVATAPNQVWTWDITKLAGPVKGVWFHLSVVLDLFSRYVVAWMIALKALARLARRLLREAFLREGVQSGPAHRPLRSWIPDDRPVGHRAVGHPRRGAESEPAPRPRRQPVLGPGRRRAPRRFAPRYRGAVCPHGSRCAGT
jgi:transposase InsO family protein